MMVLMSSAYDGKTHFFPGDPLLVRSMQPLEAGQQCLTCAAALHATQSPQIA